MSYQQPPPNNQGWQRPQQPNTQYPSQQPPPPPQWPPQYPPPSNTYYPPPQIPPYPQQHWQLPSPPPKKTNPRLALAIFAGAVLFIILASATLGKTSSPSPVAATPTADITPIAATDTPIPTATDTPSPQPTTAISGNSVITHGTPRLGGPVSDFVGKYGQPDTGCATCAKGIYNFQRISGTQIDYISTMFTDTNGHVNAFNVQGPNAGWDVATAAAICESFGPSDVNYNHPQQGLQSSDGSSVEKVYKSAWLAGRLAKSDFQDLNTTSNNTDLPPGTFDITYTYPSGPSNVSDCSLEAGIQRV